jgi:drug/metabolite transporter (DMT)-like permease
MSRLTKGTLIGITGILFWSFTAVFISRLTGYYGLRPLLLAFWRDFFVSLFLLALLVAARRRLPRIERRQVPFLLFYGLLLAGFNTVWTLSVPLNGAAVSTVLVYGSLAFIIPLSRWLFQEQITPAKLAGLALSLAGCALAAGAFDALAWDARPLGIAVGLLSGLMFACYSLAGKQAARRGLGNWETMLFSFAFASLFLLLFNLLPGAGTGGLPGRLLPQLPPLGWLLLVTLALVPTLLGYGLYNLSMRYLPVSVANLIATLEPAFTAAEAYLLLGEGLRPVQVAGSLLIVAAVVLVQVSETTRAAARAAPALDVTPAASPHIFAKEDP